MNKKELIAQLEREYRELEEDYYRVYGELHELRNAVTRKAPEIPTFRTPTLSQQLRQWWNRNPKYSASASLDILPIQDWFRLKYYPFNPGKAAQLYLGPVRLDFYQN